jgi:hypothetical protein
MWERLTTTKLALLLRERWADLAYLVLAAGILAWVAWDAVSFRLITYSPGADYWEHTAVLRALLENPWRPAHPLIASEVSSPRFGPHYLWIALVGRALGTDALGAMSIAAIVNALLFLIGIYAFFREYFGDLRAPLFGLVVMFGSWLDAPHFSNVYKLSIYFSVAGYPSSAALAVMLLMLTVLLRVLRSERERPGLWALTLVAAAYVYVTHPLTAMLAYTAAGFLALTEGKAPRRRRLWVCGAIAGSLLFASLWPYYPALGMVTSGTAARVQKGLEAGQHSLHSFYGAEELVGILGFAALSVLLFPYFAWRRIHLVVPLGTLSMLGVFGAAAFLDIPLGHRFVLLAVFFLQIGLVWLLLLALSRPRRGSPEPLPRYAARLAGALAAAVLLAVMGVTAVTDASERFARERRTGVESPTVRYGRRVAELAGPNAIIFADELPSWPLPTFGPKIVTLHHRNPLITDAEERERAARRFFGPRVSDEERWAILERFRVTHVIATPRNSPASFRFLERNGQRRGLHFGRVLFRLSDGARAPQKGP